MIYLPHIPLLGRYNIPSLGLEVNLVGAESVDGTKFSFYDGQGDTIVIKNNALKRMSKGLRVYGVWKQMNVIIEKI